MPACACSASEAFPLRWERSAVPAGLFSNALDLVDSRTGRRLSTTGQCNTGRGSERAGHRRDSGRLARLAPADRSAGISWAAQCHCRISLGADVTALFPDRQLSAVTEMAARSTPWRAQREQPNLLRIVSHLPYQHSTFDYCRRQVIGATRCGKSVALRRLNVVRYVPRQLRSIRLRASQPIVFRVVFRCPGSGL